VKKLGRPKKESKTRQVQMRLAEEFLAKIDAWRRVQPDLPSKTEAIRRLVERGLKK
jgi:hypothetical protein